MGTRHLIAVQLDGKYPIAQYGQLDGHPEGQGVDVLRFARDKMKPDVFSAKLRALTAVTTEFIKQEYAACGHTGGDWVSIDVSDRFKTKHPQLSGDAGSDILEMVQSGTDGLPVRGNIDFAGDSLFCEYAYVIDLDKGTLEAYRGLNKEVLGDDERFKDAPLSDNGYQPVRLWHSWMLSALPTDDQFFAALKDASSEDDEAA